MDMSTESVWVDLLHDELDVTHLRWRMQFCEDSALSLQDVILLAFRAYTQLLPGE